MTVQNCEAVTGGTLKKTEQLGDKEYLFFEFPFPEGDPRKVEGKPGLIKAYECWGGGLQWRRRRVFIYDLPEKLQRLFVELTGRSAAEIGVVLH